MINLFTKGRCNMKRKLILLLIGAAFLFSWVFFSSVNNSESYAVSKKTLSVGTAKVKITPKVPIPMSGYRGRKGPFKGVHDDLFARVMVFSDGENKAAIIAADVIGFSHSFWEETTKRLEQEAGISQKYIILSAVHTHGGPTTRVYNETTSPEVVTYVDELREKLVNAVKEAVNNLSSSSIGAGKGECKMNINRRAPDGKGEITLGRNPYGPCDHEVGVVRIDDIRGNPVAIFINWPCHGVVLGPRNYLITGDWPGATSRFVEKEFDNKVIAPVTAGASGDINPIYGPHIDFVDVSSYSYAVDAIGMILGKEVIRVAKDIKTFPHGSISASQRLITLPEKERKESKLLQPDYKPGLGLNVRLSALKIGNIIFTGVSGEVFNEIGVKLKKQSPYNYTIMITHCNGSSGYLVTDDSYQEGGYEVRSTRAKSGAEKAIIENLLDMIYEL